jgi:ankyrin repeat protein
MWEFNINIINYHFLFLHKVQHGENVNVPDKKGYTPLITSAQYGHIPLCSFLIGIFVDVKSI